MVCSDARVSPPLAAPRRTGRGASPPDWRVWRGALAVRSCGGPKARGDRIPGACRVTRVAHSTDGALAGRGLPAMRVKAITGWPMRAHGHNTTRAPDRRSARSHQTRQCTRMSNQSRQRPIASVPRPPAALPGPNVLRPCPLSTEPSRGHNLAVWRQNWTFYTPFRTRSS